MIRALGFKNYKEYLQSSLWYQKREFFLKLNPKCKKCRKESTEVHHISYENIGNEGGRDLMALCRKCHKKIHGVKNGRN